MRNLLTRVPKSAQGLVASLVRTIFAQPDAASTLAQHTRIVEQLESRFPAAAEVLAEQQDEWTLARRYMSAESLATAPMPSSTASERRSQRSCRQPAEAGHRR